MRWSLSLASLALLYLTTAAPLQSRQNSDLDSPNDSAAAAPTATIYPDTAGGQPVNIVGFADDRFGADVYLGVPYAQPPVNKLRFAAPQSYVYNTESYTAQTQPPMCLQNPQESEIIYGTESSEDCLFLNIFAPAGSNLAEEKVPVMVWVYGGSFTSGSVYPYNGSAFIQHSTETGKPVIHVALNYRLGALGWGVGSGFAENNATNLGLRDIKKALGWVQENIWAFGGDRDQVTVFGESAGAISISLLYLDPGTTLFSKAIMESGGPSSIPLGPQDSTWEDAYQALLKAANCVDFDCLRDLSVEAILAAQMNVKNQTAFKAGFIYCPTIDGDLIPDSPHQLVLDGKVANKPFITGNTKDEGTRFAPTSINSTPYGLLVLNLFEPDDPDPMTTSKLLQLYVNDARAGSPFDTGSQTFGLTAAYKRFAAIFGDLFFQSQRRYFLRQANAHGNTQTWTFHFEQLTPGWPEYLGISHSTEIPYVYGAARPDMGQQGFSFTYTEADHRLSDAMMNYWINFANYGNPNGPNDTANSSSNAVYWPLHDSDNKKILRLKADNISVFRDDYREAGTDFITSRPKAFSFRRSLDIGVGPGVGVGIDGELGEGLDASVNVGVDGHDGAEKKRASLTADIETALDEMPVVDLDFATSESKRDLNLGVGVGVDGELGLALKRDLDIGVGVGVGAASDLQIKRELDLEAGVGVGAGIDLNLKRDFDLEAGVDVGAGLNLALKRESDLEAGVGVGAGLKRDLKLKVDVVAAGNGILDAEIKKRDDLNIGVGVGVGVGS
ncbi:hypothetical protein L202_03383 [Cryptococcus amylolentus CBS 6039]|uniref:Carboxylesterase type B domain-containing protein n=2 Tax=Cryptococcus amylolentus TaxID=104669 RepID=A0A1E3HV33_9TREE|nr:hypothetical protein L202_03383 [Cryptococcus amylolentus CBS 6039]ODN79381.1 hypothetical protein L202_03383 [Cryptococcus amylolentus CBS 6039]ODO07766.1 hypothetical protein I350_03344 [Cryptococcus amylolentus CBS 6273]